jgi:subtilisin family serine protease
MKQSPQLLNFRARSNPQSATASNQLSNQPYTKAGILGDGQIVTIADTGLDVFSCYFYDPAGRVAPSKPNAPQFNQNLRKVIGYIYNSCGDQTDTDGGHGTHVSGTVAGSIVKADIGGGK